MQPVITPTITTSSTSTTTTSSTVSTQQNHPATPVIQSKPASERSSLIRALLNEQKTGVPPLHQSILDGNFVMAKALLASGAWVKTEIRPPLNLENQLTATLFSLRKPDRFLENHSTDATQVRNHCIVDLALKMQEASPAYKVQNVGANALTLALLCDAPIEFINDLLAVAKNQYPAILDQPDANGRTPMMIAVERGDANMVSLLLQQGACANWETNVKTVLDLCISTGHPQLLALFHGISDSSKRAVFNCIEHHVKALLTGDFTLLSRLLQAVHFFLNDDDIAKLLIAAAKVPGVAEKLPLIYGLLRGPMTNDQLDELREAAANSGDIAVYQYVRGRDRYLASVLRSISDPTIDSLVKHELIQGLKPELIRALKVDDVHFTKLLLKRGVDIEPDNSLAEEAGLKSIAAKLRDTTILNRLAKGLSVRGRLAAGTIYYTGFSTGDYSGVTSEEAFMRMLVADNRLQNDATKSVDILKEAIIKNYAICVDYLLQKGAPVHDPSLDEWSYLQGSQPLALAIKNENVEITRALLNAGAVPSEREISNAGYSKNPEFVRLFDNYH